LRIFNFFFRTPVNFLDFEERCNTFLFFSLEPLDGRPMLLLVQDSVEVLGFFSCHLFDFVSFIQEPHKLLQELLSMRPNVLDASCTHVCFNLAPVFAEEFQSFKETVVLFRVPFSEVLPLGFLFQDLVNFIIELITLFFFHGAFFYLEPSVRLSLAELGLELIDEEVGCFHYQMWHRLALILI